MNWWFIGYVIAVVVGMLYKIVLESRSDDDELGDNALVFAFLLVVTIKVFVVFMAVKQGF